MEQQAVGVSDFDFEMERVRDLAMEPAHKLDHTLHVRFYKHAELNSFKSQKAGRKMFEDKVYVRIQSPANRLNIIERAASDEDKLRFARQYQLFLQGAEQMTQGTPVGELPGITPARALELKALKVETVEQLADLADNTVNLLGTGGQQIKQQARRYLDRLANSEALSDQVRAQDAKITELMRQLAELQANNIAAAAQAPTGQVVVTAKAEPKAPVEKA